MNKDTVIGVGVGVLLGWLLWRRRGLMGSAMVAGSGGGCAGCAGSSSNVGTAAGAAPGSCARSFSAGLGNFAQGSGPNPIPGF